MVVLLGTSLAADYTMQQGGAEPPLNFFHSHDMWSGTRMVAADPGLTSLDNVSLDDENELHMDEALLMVMSEDEEIYYVFIHYLVCEGVSIRNYFPDRKFMGLTWGPSGADRPHVGPMNFAVWVTYYEFWNL